MNPLTTPRSFRLLLAAGGLALAAAAQAAVGVTIASADEARVVPGMSSAAVEKALGRPALNRSYGNEPGATWTYHVSGNGQTVFDVQFDATGTVLEATERADDSGHAHGRR